MSTKKIKTLHPVVQKKALEHKQKCKDAGIELLIYCGTRTLEEQADYYAIGRTKPGKIVTWAKPGKSWHNFALAWDCVEVINGKCQWEGKNWEKIGNLGKECGMEWGGDWPEKKRDRPHFQFRGGLTLSEAMEKFKKGEDLFPKPKVEITYEEEIVEKPVTFQQVIEIIKKFIKSLSKS